MNNLDSLNPDWVAAKAHRKATSVGIIQQNIGVDEPRCKCCDNPIQKKPLNIFDNTKQLQFLGYGFPLFFVFFKYCIVLFLLQSILTSIFGISWALQENNDFCLNGKTKVIPHSQEYINCSGLMILIARTQNALSDSEIALRIISFFIYLVLLIYIRDHLTKLNEYYDERSTTFSDYCLLINRLPKKNGIKNDIRNFLNNYNLNQIVLITDFSKLFDLQNTKMELIQKLKQLLKTKSSQHDLQTFVSSQVEVLNQKINKIEAQSICLIESEIEKIDQDNISAQKAILYIDSDEEKQQILKQFENNILKYPQSWNKEQIQLSQAPEPKQIIWQNINISFEDKIKKQILSWICFAIFLTLITFLFYAVLTAAPHQIQKLFNDHSKSIKSAFTYTSLLFIILFNKFLLTLLIDKICDFQKSFTKSEREMSFTLKYLLGQFFTTALMTLFVENLTNHNIYREDFGVIENQTIMVFLSAFFVPFIWLVNPGVIISYCKRKISYGCQFMTQLEANIIMEKPTYILGKRYAQILKIVWFISLYSSLIPIGFPLSTIGLIIYYWIDKYNLYYRSSIQQNVSGYLTPRIIKLLDFSLVLKPVGQFLFDFQIRENYSTSSIICIAISLIYFFLPMNLILQKIHHQEFKKEQLSFNEAKGYLGKGYIELHPVLGKRRYLFQLKEMICLSRQNLEQVNQLNDQNQKYCSIESRNKFLIEDIKNKHDNDIKLPFLQKNSFQKSKNLSEQKHSNNL